VAPSLDSLIIRGRENVADILEFMKHKHVDLRRLILEFCELVEGNTGLLANIVALHPDLEGLSLEACRELPSDGYRLIPSLKKLSELTLRNCEVHHVCVNLLETHV
jgi:hypothetical protein